MELYILTFATGRLNFLAALTYNTLIDIKLLNIYLEVKNLI